MFVCECERASCSEEVRVQSKEGRRSAASGVSCSELIKKHKLATYHIVCVCEVIHTAVLMLVLQEFHPSNSLITSCHVAL